MLSRCYFWLRYLKFFFFFFCLQSNLIDFFKFKGIFIFNVPRSSLALTASSCRMPSHQQIAIQALNLHNSYTAPGGPRYDEWWQSHASDAVHVLWFEHYKTLPDAKWNLSHCFTFSGIQSSHLDTVMLDFLIMTSLPSKVMKWRQRTGWCTGSHRKLSCLYLPYQQTGC